MSHPGFGVRDLNFTFFPLPACSKPLVITSGTGVLGDTGEDFPLDVAGEDFPLDMDYIASGRSRSERVQHPSHYLSPPTPTPNPFFSFAL